MRKVLNKFIRFSLTPFLFLVLSACSESELTPGITTKDSEPALSSDVESTEIVKPTNTILPSSTPTIPPTETATITPSVTPTFTPTPIENQIAFFTRRQGEDTSYHDYIYRMNSDGSGVTPLVEVELDRPSGSGEFQEIFSWSPDGEWIVYASKDDGDYDLYVVDVYGKTKIKLFDSDVDEWLPTWSPDGKYIAYGTENNAYILDVETQKIEHIGEVINGIYVGEFAWIPHSPMVTYLSIGSYNSIWTIFRGKSSVPFVNHDGTKIHSLTWSPDGDQFAYIANVKNISQTGLFISSADSTENGTPILVKDKPWMDLDSASWSPSGEKIVFSVHDILYSEKKGNGTTNYSFWEIYTIDPNGENLNRLTSHSPDYIESVNYQFPAWSPDGSKIAFTSRDGRGNWDILSMNADGSEKINLTNGEGVMNEYPRWQPSKTTMDVQIPIENSELLPSPELTATPSDFGNLSGLPKEIYDSITSNGYICEASQEGPFQRISFECKKVEDTISYFIEFETEPPTEMLYLMANIEWNYEFATDDSNEQAVEFLGYLAKLPFEGNMDLQEQAESWVTEEYLARPENETYEVGTTIQEVNFDLTIFNRGIPILMIYW